MLLWIACLVAVGDLRGLIRIYITVNSDDLRSIGKWKYFDVMEFIEKYARVEESDDEMEDDAGGDEVSESF